MRVFVGEPGGEHRETLETASRAAAAGGVTNIVTMPDTNPVIDDPALVDFMLRRARDTGKQNGRRCPAARVCYAWEDLRNQLRAGRRSRRDAGGWYATRP